MRSSTILTLLGATWAVATPLAHNRLHKKAIVTDIVTDIVYVTVTEGEIPTPPTTVHIQKTVVVNPVEATSSSTSSEVKKVKPTSSEPTSTYVPPPPPTTSTTPPAPTTTTEAPPPTTEAPAPVTTTTQAPVVEVAATTSAAPVAATTAASTTSSDPLSGTGIDKHNTCRSAHSAENVTWNSTLADAASKLANTCVWGHDMTIDGGGYGQNIASQGSSSSDAWTLESALENAIIDEWYSEASLFASLYGQESPSESGGDWSHFTQIVWKGSLEIGCAVAACPTSNSIFPGMYTWYTVCNYYPQGNILGEFTENVAAS